MKKTLVLFLVVFFISGQAFAARVKYVITTGEIVSMANTKDNKVSAGEALMDVQKDVVSDIQNYKVDSDGTFRPKTASELAADKASKDQEKSDRKTRKKSVMTKLGISKVELKALIELIQDGNDD